MTLESALTLSTAFLALVAVIIAVPQTLVAWLQLKDRRGGAQAATPVPTLLPFGTPLAGGVRSAPQQASAVPTVDTAPSGRRLLSSAIDTYVAVLPLGLGPKDPMGNPQGWIIAVAVLVFVTEVLLLAATRRTIGMWLLDLRLVRWPSRTPDISFARAFGYFFVTMYLCGLIVFVLRFGPDGRSINDRLFHVALYRNRI